MHGECKNKSGASNNGTISNLFLKYLRNIPGKHKIHNYRQHPHWALHTWEITLHVP